MLWGDRNGFGGLQTVQLMEGQERHTVVVLFFLRFVC